jgi:hypothetical protein
MIDKEKLSSLKNIYKEKRCFLVGNGPSLLKTDLELMKNDISFALNRISIIYPKTKWRPTHYVLVSECMGHNFPHIFEQDIDPHLNMGIPVFLNSDFANPGKCPRYEKYVGLKDRIHFVNCYGDRNYPYFEKDWSYDITKTTTKPGSSIIALIQIACYMGFKNIYLIGCDLGYKDIKNGVDVNHFMKEYDFVEHNASIHNNIMADAHGLAKKMTNKIGVKIYNATVGGNLEVYPRVDFNTLFEQDKSVEYCHKYL